MKLHELPDADTAGTAVPLELAKAVGVELEPAVDEEVELDPQAARPRLQIAPHANAARTQVGFIEAEV